MAERRPPPPSGGGSHGGAPSAADRIEDRRMRRPRPPSLPVADPVGGAPLLAGRERPADPVPPPGTGVGEDERFFDLGRERAASASMAAMEGSRGCSRK
jgi:hypothetical protein